MPACLKISLAGSTMADGNRLAPQLRVIALFHRRIEGVHVDMDDLAHGHGFGLDERDG